MFIHLHTHSYYSFLQGVPSPQDLVQAAAVQGMPALALTDMFGLTGAVEFYENCLNAGIKPILGLELPVNHEFGQGSLNFLALDLDGWGSICHLSSDLQTKAGRDFSVGVDWDVIECNQKGLICLTGGDAGLPAQLLQKGEFDLAAAYIQQLKDVFHDRLYVELQIHRAADRLWCEAVSEIANRLQVAVVASQDVHYITNDQAEFQRTLAAMRENTSRTKISSECLAPTNAIFASIGEMEEKFRAFPGAVEKTIEIANRCNLELPLGVPRFPDVHIPEGGNIDDHLKALAYQGAVKYYGTLNRELKERLDHELHIIKDRGYAPLFLIMQDILGYARSAGVPTSSRGSAASSLVAHCLGITTPDPIQLNLYFERFLNPARKAPPDIDTDLCSVRRGKVIRYVYQRFGPERVAMVATINHFRSRSALREAAKAHDLPASVIGTMVDQLPFRGWGPPAGRRPKDGTPFEVLSRQYPDVRFRAVFQDAETLLKYPRHLSIHPGGIVVAPGRLTDLVPVHLASKGITITQFDLSAIEKLGLVKVDLLGTKGLSVLGDLAEQIFSWRRADFRMPLEVLDKIPEDDPDTARLVEAAQTIGCFQIESPGMRITLREINAHSPEDIMVALALYRPGPLTGGLKDTFVRRHLGKEAVTHLHPALGTVLKNTYGVILYQEQVLRIASDLAGLSLADADLLRRAMSHFDPGEQMKTLQRRFLEGVQEKSGIPEAVGEQIWQLMVAFAGYGFPKAHAAAYAQIAWQSAWCKTHFPAEFMAAVMANWGGYYRQSVYLNETRRLGLELRPPHVNAAGHEFKVAYPKGQPVIYMGLNQVRDLTRETQRRIIRDRPFDSLNDFLTRVDPRAKEVENLIKVGAFSGFGTIPALLNQVEKGGWRFAQPALFELEDQRQDNEWDLKQRVSAQEEILGTGIDAHPTALVDPRLLNSFGEFFSTVDALDKSGERVRVFGLRQTLQRVFGHEGDPYFILELEDPAGVIPVLLDQALYRRYQPILTGRKLIVVEGTIRYFEKLGLQMMFGEKLQRIG